MAEHNENLWAPWRLEYIQDLAHADPEAGCFLCHYWNDPSRDDEHRVVWRTERSFTVLNLFPYTNGHLLIAPSEHVGDPAKFDADRIAELACMTQQAVGLLTEAVHPQGFNIGINVGRCAGAGLPDHVHVHVVPRWNGDTNFMPVLGDVRVIPQSLDKLHSRLVIGAQQMGLRD